MKSRIIFISGLFLALGFTSCVEDDVITTSNQLVKTISVTGQDFQSEEAVTKATYTVDGTGMHFSWTEGDTVGIYPVGGDQVAFPISSGEGSQTAQFDGGAWALRSSYSYAAYYPYVKGNYMVDETQIPVSFIGQTQNENGSLDCLDKFDYQASAATRPDADGNVNIELKHLGSFVRFQFKMPIADTYKSITLTSSQTPFVTSGTFDLTKDDIAITSTTTSPSITINLNNTAVTTENKVLTVYAMLAPTDLIDSEISISIEGTTYKSYSATITGKNMIAGKAYSYTAKVQSGTNINGSDVEWDDEGQEILPPFEYVDLGLSVNWATFNVGSKKPEDYGDYYAWGETEIKSNYWWDLYKWCNGSSSEITNSDITKYNSIDYKRTLDLEDDVAHVKWGGNWRMPTNSELDELRTNCTWIWTTVNGINGYCVTSNVTGYENCSLFIPSSGFARQDGVYNIGKTVEYWSSSGGGKVAETLYGGGPDSHPASYFADGRCIGHPVRPVWPKHQYVDLGLSVKWATCNMGASKPEEYGDYYAWGETKPKDDYSWASYKYCKGSINTLIKYCDVQDCGYNNYTDYLSTIESDDDAAKVNWGGNWRLPTRSEINELLNNCTWTWTTVNGVNGCQLTSKISGYENQSIFIPATGRKEGSVQKHVGSFSAIWSDYSSNLDAVALAYTYDISNGNISYYTTYPERSGGISIRPVCP